MTKLEAWKAWCESAGTPDLATEFTLEQSSHGKAFSFAWESGFIEGMQRQMRLSVEKALEEQQEPVAWITNGGKGELWWYQSSKFDEEGNLIGPNPDDIPLYTAPPKKPWVGLTLNEAEEFYDKYTDRAELINAIDSFLEEKNT